MTIAELAQRAPFTFNAAFLLEELAAAMKGASDEAIDESADVKLITARIRELMDAPGLSDMQLREAAHEYEQMNSLLIVL